MGLMNKHTEEAVDLKSSDKYDILRAGGALAHFLASVDTVTSEIGEYKKATRIGGQDYIVTGLQITHKASPVNILSDLNNNLEVSNKFTTFMGKPAIQILKAYLATLGDDKEEYKTAVFNKFKGITGNKNLITPFKPTDECVVAVGEGKSSKDETAEISSVLWGMDKETGKFQARVLAKVENAGVLSKTYKIPLTEYGTAFKISGIERCMKVSNIDRRTVTMTRFGFIKPVVIKDGNIALAIDGSHLYVVMNGIPTIIGNWNDNGELIETAVAKSLNKHKAYKHLKNNLGYIERHIRFIAPYGLTEPVEIQL